MGRYVMLINFTDQGIRDYKGSVERSRKAKDAFRSKGATLSTVYWTLGAYDIVALAEAPDDETITAANLALGALGNVRTTTLRAFDESEMQKIVAKASG
ncbi:MAG TPA: GYD domain-containing protein [Candidatus Limnocylindrales bacterium]|jgi:uncharacterized protein with GYD domain|nr:GYD domain-containing protein [Candidatus Limnocylindrales bacterium]